MEIGCYQGNTTKSNSLGPRHPEIDGRMKNSWICTYRNRKG